MATGSGFVVLDTSVVSILFNEADDERYAYYQQRVAGRRGLISFQTLEELLYWRIAGAWAKHGHCASDAASPNTRSSGLTRFLSQSPPACAAT